MSFLRVFFQIFLGLSPLILLWVFFLQSHILIGTSVSLQFTYQNHLNKFSLILSSITITPTLPRITRFLILSFIVYPHIQESILNYAILIFTRVDAWLPRSITFLNSTCHRKITILVPSPFSLAIRVALVIAPFFRFKWVLFSVSICRRKIR